MSFHLSKNILEAGIHTVLVTLASEVRGDLQMFSANVILVGSSVCGWSYSLLPYHLEKERDCLPYIHIRGVYIFIEKEEKHLSTYEGLKVKDDT